MKRANSEARGSGSWTQTADGSWQPAGHLPGVALTVATTGPGIDRAPSLGGRRLSQDHTRKKNRLKDPRVAAQLQRAARKIMMVKAFRDTLKTELGEDSMRVVDAMLDESVRAAASAPSRARLRDARAPRSDRGRPDRGRPCTRTPPSRSTRCSPWPQRRRRLPRG